MKGRAFDSCLIFICHTWVQPTVHGTRIIVRMRILLGTYCFCLTQKKPKIRTGVEIGKHKSLRPEKGVWGRNIYPKTIAIRLYYPNWREMTSQLQYTKLANWLLSRIFKIWAFFSILMGDILFLPRSFWNSLDVSWMLGTRNVLTRYGFRLLSMFRTGYYLESVKKASMFVILLCM